MRTALIALSLTLAAPAAHAQGSPWQTEPSETTADLRGVHAAGAGVVWASGTGGTVLRSEDSGFEWQQCAVPPGADTLDFRAIWGFDDENALVMSSGSGGLSRLYRTTDGCAHWTLAATNADKDGFWDGLVFSDRNNGFLVGDPVGGQLFVEETIDGGAHWTRLRAEGHAPGLDTKGRGLFAASNSSIALGGGVVTTPHGAIHVPWIGTGGPGGALVLNGGIDCGMDTAHREPDSCLQHWDFQQQVVPMTGTSQSAGVFSLAVTPGRNMAADRVIAVGGDYLKPDAREGTAAVWTQPSNTWHAARTMPLGYRSAVGWSNTLRAWIAVGPNGSDISRDGGENWHPLEHAPTPTPRGGEWNALSLPWAVGPHGRIGKLNTDLLAHPPR